MSTHLRNATKASLLALCTVLSASAGGGPFFDLSENETLTAVSSKAYGGYVRNLKPDGTYVPENYSFGNGGDLGSILGRDIVEDPTFDRVGFMDIARTLAVPLARQNYLPGHDPRTTKLLIMVYWGTTTGGVNVRNGYVQDSLNFANARLLGFDTQGPFEGMTDPASDPAAYFWGPTYRSLFLEKMHGDTMSAIEMNRYYVILRAFDFQAAWKQKKLKLLWETRFSLTQRLHDFGKDLPAMAQSASMYFGHDSYGLVMRPVPEGRVDVGEPVVLDDISSHGDLGSIAGDWAGRSQEFSSVVFHIDRNGNSTFENSGRHWVAPASVSVSGDEVTIKVPGWGVYFHGTIKGEVISGNLSRYGHGGLMTLKKEARVRHGLFGNP